MNEAVAALVKARKAADSYRDEQATLKTTCETNAAAAAKEVARMDNRITEIDAAIAQLGGE